VASFFWCVSRRRWISPPPVGVRRGASTISRNANPVVQT
jgi:hypothetical protein